MVPKSRYYYYYYFLFVFLYRGLKAKELKSKLEWLLVRNVVDGTTYNCYYYCNTCRDWSDTVAKMLQGRCTNSNVTYHVCSHSNSNNWHSHVRSSL